MVFQSSTKGSPYRPDPGPKRQGPQSIHYPAESFRTSTVATIVAPPPAHAPEGRPLAT